MLNAITLFEFYRKLKDLCNEYCKDADSTTISIFNKFDDNYFIFTSEDGDIRLVMNFDGELKAWDRNNNKLLYEFLKDLKIGDDND